MTYSQFKIRCIIKKKSVNRCYLKFVINGWKQKQNKADNIDIMHNLL